MRALGPMYIRGRDVTQDPAFGLDLMKRAVEKGSIGAANEGLCCKPCGYWARMRSERKGLGRVGLQGTPF